jgi:hypothetical protein
MSKGPSKQIMSSFDPEYEALLQESAGLDIENLRLSDFRKVRLSDRAGTHAQGGAMNPTKEQLDELWDVLEEEYKKERRAGLVGARLSDYGGDWEECKTLAQHWPTILDLLDQLDNTREPRLLLPLLNIPPEARPHFEDLFDRLVFKLRNKESRRTPSYRPSKQQQKLSGALWEVDNRPRTVTKDKAIEAAARSWGINKTALALAAKGQHTSFRRRRGRR